jgi:hypothetical protein
VREAKRGAKKRRVTQVGWHYFRNVPAVLHDAECDVCARFLAHILSARREDPSLEDARQDEYDDWYNLVRSEIEQRAEAREDSRPPLGAEVTSSRGRSTTPRQPSLPLHGDSRPRDPSRVRQLEGEISKQAKQIAYLEDMAEWLRRQAVKVPGGRLMNTWSGRAVRMSDEDLLDSIKRGSLNNPYYRDPYEATSSDDDVEDPEETRRAYRKHTLEKGHIWKSRTATSPSTDGGSPPRRKGKGRAHDQRPLSERLASPEAPSLADRMEVSPPPLAERLNDARPAAVYSSWGDSSVMMASASSAMLPPGFQPSPAQGTPFLSAQWTPSVGPLGMLGRDPPTGPRHAMPWALPATFVVAAEVVAGNYLPKTDEAGSVVPMEEIAPGRWRIVYEVAVDLGLPFPPSPPSRWCVNPLTGRLWTRAELTAYPQGLPGYPSHLLAPSKGGGPPW